MIHTYSCVEHDHCHPTMCTLTCLRPGVLLLKDVKICFGIKRGVAKNATSEESDHHGILPASARSTRILLLLTGYPIHYNCLWWNSWPISWFSLIYNLIRFPSWCNGVDRTSAMATKNYSHYNNYCSIVEEFCHNRYVCFRAGYINLFCFHKSKV